MDLGSCACCRSTGTNLRPIPVTQKEFLFGSDGLLRNRPNANETVFSWCTPCRKIGTAALHQTASSSGKAKHGNLFQRKRKSFETTEDVVQAFDEVGRRKRFRRGDGTSMTELPANDCTLCVEVMRMQARMPAGVRPFPHIDAVPHINDAQQSSGDCRRPVSHSAVAQLFDTSSALEVSNLYRGRRAILGEHLPQASVEEINMGASPDRKVCQVHYQAFRKTSRRLVMDTCSLCSKSVHRSDSTSLSMWERSLSEADKLVVVETVIAIVPSLRDVEVWEKRIASDLNAPRASLNNAAPHSTMHPADNSPDRAVEEILAEGRACLRCFLILKRKINSTVDGTGNGQDLRGQTAAVSSHPEQDRPTHEYSGSESNESAEGLVRFDMDVEQFGNVDTEAEPADEAIIFVCAAEEQRLNANVGTVGYACDLYERYIARLQSGSDNGDRAARTMRTVLRYIVRSTSIVVFGYSETSKGSILISKATVAMFEKSGAKDTLQSSDSDIRSIRESLLTVAAIYKDREQKEKYRSGKWNLLHELRRFDSRLWALQWRLVESERKRIRRIAAEKLDATGDKRLSWPFTNAPSASDSDFKALTLPVHRKVMRIFSLLQQMVYVRDKDAVGPLIWGISTCALLQSNKPFMTLMNRLGYCMSYTTMNRERCGFAKSEMAKPAIEKVLQHLLLKFSWDNLDARLVANTVRLVGKSLDWHGTILIASQMPTTPSIVTADPFRIIDTVKYPRAEMVVREAVSNSKTVRFFNVVVASLVAVFQANLTASLRSDQVSLDYLIRRAVQGFACGKEASIANLILLDRPSNDTSTARELMDEASRLAAQQVEKPEILREWCATA